MRLMCSHGAGMMRRLHVWTFKPGATVHPPNMMMMMMMMMLVVVFVFNETSGKVMMKHT